MKRCLLLLLVICLWTGTALAWSADRSYATIDELPPNVRQSFPASETFLYGYGNGKTIYALLDMGTERRVRIYAETEDGYTQQSVSAPLPAWRGITAGIGSSSDDCLYLSYGDGQYASIARRQDGSWQLALWCLYDTEPDTYLTFTPNALHVTLLDNTQSQKSSLYGDLQMPLAFEKLDVSLFPETAQEAAALVDTAGWAVVRTPSADMELPLFTEPREGMVTAFRYYTGAPVQVLTEENGWTRVKIGSMTGWMPSSDLIMGADMLQVQHSFPYLLLLDSAFSSHACVYEEPSTSAQKVTTLQETDDDSWTVIGLSTDGWYCVKKRDGCIGFMEQVWFGSGNG